MEAWLGRFSYLATALMVAALLSLGLVVFPRQRASAVKSAIVALPFGLWALVLVPDYWTPRLLIPFGQFGPFGPFGRAGIEDFLWAFCTGGLTWLLASTSRGPILAARYDQRAAAMRYAATTTAGCLVFLPLWLTGIPVIHASFLVMAAPAVFLLLRSPGQWRLALRGAIGFGILNALVMKANLIVHPDYYAQMTAGALSGITLSGVPFEELHWAFATGASWPLLVCYVFGAEAAPAASRRA